MWPDIRMPLNTRDGNAEDPIEPVIWNIDPCDFGPPPKWCRFTTPAKPRPLLMPTISTKRSPSKMSTRTRWPTFRPFVSALSLDCSSTSRGTSRRNFIGGRLLLAKCPCIGLVSFFSFTNSTRPIWADSYPSRVAVLCWVITHGPACSTVAGRTSPFESNSCVMPTFFPRIPATFAIALSVPAWPLAIGWGSCLSYLLFVLFAKRLDLHIHSGGKIKLHQRVHGLRRGIENVQQTFVGADLELLARLFVHVR